MADSGKRNAARPMQLAPEIPLHRWISGDPSRRPARWAGWRLWPSGDPSYQRTIGSYIVRANRDAGGFYAELADAASGRTLAFVYPFPMKAWWMSFSRTGEYDWANIERDKEAAIVTALAVARVLTVSQEAAQPHRGVLDLPLPELPSRAEAMDQAEAARRRAKAARRTERPKRRKQDPAAVAWLRRQLEGLGRKDS
jgi:hypothetical protein